MAAKHKHQWLTQYYAFPEEGDELEHAEPYEVQYCSDRECGERRTVVISVALAQEVRAFNQLPDRG